MILGTKFPKCSTMKFGVINTGPEDNDTDVRRELHHTVVGFSHNTGVKRLNAPESGQDSLSHTRIQYCVLGVQHDLKSRLHESLLVTYKK